MTNLKLFGAASGLTLALLATVSHAEPFRILVTSNEVPLVPNSVLHLALSEGYFERAGVEVELIAVEQTPMAVTALRTGAGEMANISLETLLGLHARGDHELKAVGTTDKAIPYIIAARKGTSFEDLSDGEPYGVGRVNSLDHTMSSLVLQSRGVAVSSMNWVPLGQPAVRAAALGQGRVVATTMSVGVYQSIPDRADLEIMVDVKEFYEAAPILSKINAVPQQVLDTRADDVEAVLEALTLAARDYTADPGRWVEAMVKARPDIARAELESLAQIYAASFTVNGGLEADEAEYSQTWLYQTNTFQGEPVVGLERWADFGPQAAVLEKIGRID